MTDDQGRFELKVARDQKGVTLGTHKVVATFRSRNPQEEADHVAGKVIRFHPEQDAIFEKYGKPETTKMTVEITKATNNLELKFD